MASTVSLAILLPTVNSVTFLPLATISFEAPFSSAFASSACSFRLAGTVSDISMSFASRNLDARPQLVQPLRK